MMDLMTVHPATRADCDQIWALLQPVFSAGDTYAVDPLIDRDAAITYWMDAEKTAFILRVDGQAVGTYYIRPNQPGGGAHICNCGFITAPSARGKGVARAALWVCNDRSDSAGVFASKAGLCGCADPAQIFVRKPQLRYIILYFSCTLRRLFGCITAVDSAPFTGSRWP